MRLESCSKCICSSKSLPTAFVILICSAIVIFCTLIWPTVSVNNIKQSQHNFSMMLKHEKDKVFNVSRTISFVNSNNYDLADLVAREIRNRTILGHKPCPETPPGLVGQLAINLHNITESVTNERSLKRVLNGGRFIPEDCLAKERTAIIIPYRDREAHLDSLIRHLHNILQRQQLEYQLFVIEMALPTQFNRGLLANLGVVIAKESGAFSCFIIHDVDLLMMNDKNLYKCGTQPRHLVTGSTKFRSGNNEYGLPYDSYVSGVIALSESQYTKANGFSNVYFGWGGEDDDFNIRVQSANMSFERPEKDIGIFMSIPHEIDNTNIKNPARFGILDASTPRKSIEGINSFYNNRLKIRHKRYAIEYRRYYTWSLVGVNEAAITKQYEKYLGEPFAL